MLSNQPPVAITDSAARPSPPPPQRLAYWIWLLGPTLVLSLAVAMSVGDGRTVLLPGLGALPETCTLHTQVGIDCPGCGLTRSFIHLAHGRLAAAWELNPVGLSLFLFMVAQIPLAVAHLRAHELRLAPPAKWLVRWNQTILVLLMLALLLQWLIRLFAGDLIQ